MTTGNNERILGLRQDYREQNNLIYKPAFLGDASGNYIDPNFPGYVIIRELTSNGLSQPRRAFLPANLSLVLKAGAPIKLGRDEFAREVILGADSNNTLNAGINTVYTVQNTSTGSTTQGLVETLRCVAQSVPSLVVTVKGWTITTASGYTEFPGSTIDLTSHVPSSGNMRYVVVAVKSDYATLEATDSTPRLSSDLPLGPADVSEAVALLSVNSTSVWAIKLVGDQTEITQQSIDNDGKDLRQLVNTTASNDVVGPASSTDNAVVRFDGTTGKLVQNSGVIIDDSNNVTIPGRTITQSGHTVKVRVVTAAGAVTVTTADYLICINKTVGAATTVNLPASPTAGDIYIIKDKKGDAATNNITLTPAAGNIDGAGTYVMNINRQSVMVIYDGSEWSVN
jgi:hypothetical protein